MKQSILVVDNEPTTRYLLRLLLESDGFQVHEADYGMDALEKAKANQPDLMIFDVMQKSETGFAVCKPDVAQQTAVLPIIMLTAKTQWSIFSELLRDTVMQYLPKPIAGKELVTCIQQVLGNPQTTVSNN
ncbi:MAG: response regulator [Chloroflexi bacterium]|nr:response regulator [Chloroflexota bacterium]